MGCSWRATSLQSTTKEQIKKMWNIYTTEYYSIPKNNDIMKFGG